MTHFTPGSTHTAYTQGKFYNSWQTYVKFDDYGNEAVEEIPGEHFQIWLMKRWRKEAKLPEAPRSNSVLVLSDLHVPSPDLMDQISMTRVNVNPWLTTPMEALVPLEDKQTQSLIDDLVNRSHNDFVRDWVRLAHRSFQQQEEILRRLDRMERDIVVDELADEKQKSRFEELL